MLLCGRSVVLAPGLTFVKDDVLENTRRAGQEGQGKYYIIS